MKSRQRDGQHKKRKREINEKKVLTRSRRHDNITNRKSVCSLFAYSITVFSIAPDFRLLLPAPPTKQQPDQLALAKGKKLYDKREAAAEKSAKREIEKAMKERSRCINNFRGRIGSTLKILPCS